MSAKSPHIGYFARLKLLWFHLLRSILHIWVKARILPHPFEGLELDRSKPLCYVIDTYSLSDLLILDQACEQMGLPRPTMPLQLKSGDEPRSYLALRRRARYDRGSFQACSCSGHNRRGSPFSTHALSRISSVVSS